MLSKPKTKPPRNLQGSFATDADVKPYVPDDPLLTPDEVRAELGNISWKLMAGLIERGLLREPMKISAHTFRWPRSEVMKAREKIPRGRGAGGRKPREKNLA